MKTKMNIKSIILIAMICLSSLFFINMSFAANTAKIKVETANLREEPSADSKILEQASVGDEVEVLEKSGEWYKVKYKSITGYLRNDLLELTETANIINNVTVNEADINIVSNTVNETTNNTTVTEVTNQEDNTLGTYKLINDAKLKITPLINSLDIKTVKANEQVEVTNIINDWANVTTSEGTQGWIRTEKIQKNTSTENNTVVEENNQQTTETVTQSETNLNVKMYVNTQTVNLREAADKTAKIVTQLEINKEVNVLSKENGWSYVEVDGKKGYVSTSLLSTTKQTTSRSTMNQRTTTKTTSNNATTDTTAKASNTTASTTTSSSTTNTTSTASTGKGSEVVAYAKTLLGCKYVYGGTTPSGFDCSGFTQYVYKHFGVNLNRTAAAQYSNGKSVTSLQAGDLVMFGKSGISHVGIYIGGNSFIHAANPSKGVRIDSLSSGYYKTNYVGARRIY
ncbi:MAG: SH3 domain-containing protein [Clostridia bacterium]